MLLHSLNILLILIVLGPFSNALASAGRLDLSFPSLFEEGAVVYDLKVQPDAKILVAGRFAVRGTTRRNIVRLNPDGSLDASFTSVGGISIEFIRAIALLSDGKILLGGSGNEIGQPMTRLNPDGRRDTTFNVSGTIPGPLIGVYQIAVQPDGRLLVHAGNISGGSGILRLDANGAQDRYVDVFAQSQTPSYNTIRVNPDGKILIGGRFDYNISGQIYNSLLRLNPDLTIDTSFRLRLQGIAITGSNIFYVNGLEQLPDGRILIWGRFLTVNGWNKPNIAIVNPDGSSFSSFFFTPPTNGPIHDVAMQPDGKFIVHADPEDNLYCCSGRSMLFRLDANGRYDSTFRVGREPKGIIQTLAITNENKLLVAGEFWRFNGIPRQAIVRLGL